MVFMAFTQRTNCTALHCTVKWIHHKLFAASLQCDFNIIIAYSLSVWAIVCKCSQNIHLHLHWRVLYTPLNNFSARHHARAARKNKLKEEEKKKFNENKNIVAIFEVSVKPLEICWLCKIVCMQRKFRKRVWCKSTWKWLKLIGKTSKTDMDALLVAKIRIRQSILSGLSDINMFRKCSQIYACTQSSRSFCYYILNMI